MSIFSSFGTDVNGLSLVEANEKADLNWSVNKSPIVADNNGISVTTNRFFATVRTDNDTILGIVGPDYQVIQNQELGFMAEQISDKVKIETAGCLGGGQRVWYLMRGNSFNVGKRDDEVRPYTLFTSVHNGLHALDILPTSVRVICENTLNLALSTRKMGISIKHTGNVQERIDSLVDGIQQFQKVTEVFANKANDLANKNVTVEFVQKFWTQVYMNMFGDIHNNPSNEKEVDANNRAASVMIRWSNTFDEEAGQVGYNMWNAANAVTNWLDHGQIYRGNKKTENKFNDVVFGNRAKYKIDVMNAALALV